ncbi:MAG: rhodanese-like domain-containing protein [Proteobacteria bacterium]|nr:rhodanese-like domain-containing protein [Pseudomonadota bacterium]
MAHLLWVSASLLLLALWPAAQARAGNTFQYMSGQELEQRLRASDPIIVLDIQVESEYEQHHVKGATPTHAYPVKSSEDKAKLDEAMPGLKRSSAPVVIVCPRGAGGAERTYAYLKDQGIPEERLYILEKGQAGWSCAEPTEGQAK